MTFIPLGFFHLTLERSSIRGDKEGRDVDRTVRELGASEQAGACGRRLRSPASQPATGQAGLSHERGLVPGACGSVKPPPQAVMEEPPPPPGAERACPREGPHAGLGTEDTESCDTDHCALGQVPRDGPWTLHVHPGLHSSWRPEVGLAGEGCSLVSRILSQTGPDPTQGLRAEFPEARAVTYRGGDRQHKTGSQANV